MANINLKTDSSFVDLDQLSTRNLLINGNFDYWQRNNSFSAISSTATYTADRFVVRTGGTITVNATKQTDTEYPRYLFRIRAASSGSDIVQMGQQIEYDMFRKYLGKRMTVTIRAKAANSNAASTAQYIIVQYITGGTIDANVKFGTGSTGSLYTPVTLTTSMANYSFSFTLPINTTSLFIQFGSGAVQSFTITVDGFDMSWMVLAPVASAVDRPLLAGNSITEELVLCQRYYEKSYATETNVGAATNQGASIILVGTATTNNLGHNVYFKAQKRNASFTVYYWDDSGTANRCYKGSDGKLATVPLYTEHNFWWRTNDATNANEADLNWAVENEL